MSILSGTDNGHVAASGLTRRDELDAALHQWLRSGKQLLHVEGAPGAGKTSWIKVLVQTPEVRDAQGHLLALHAAHELCTHNQTTTASTNAFLEKLCQHFTRLEPGYARALVERSIALDVQIDARGAVGASVVGIAIAQLVLHASGPGDKLHALLAPLASLLAEPGPDWLIIVDSPDEPKDRSLADLLVSLGRMPPRLRWLITSRANPAFARGLARAGAAYLDLAETGHASPSLRRFVAAEASALGLLGRLAGGVVEDTFLATLLAQVNDNFLVARCALDALTATRGRLDLDVIKRLPDTLPGYYLTSLDAIVRSIGDTWIDECGPLLGSLAVARMPLGEAELAALSRQPEDRVRDRLRRFLPYLCSHQDGWRLFHATFAEFLLDREVAQDFWCMPSEQHKRFVRWIDPFGCWSKAAPYGLAHVVSHIIGADERTLTDQLDAVLSADFIAARLARGHASADLTTDFKRMLAATAAASEVARTVVITLLLALWQDMAGARASHASTSLLAAQGRIAEASVLAQQQDAAGHEDASSGSIQRAGYARRLVMLAEFDAAVDFARAAAASGDDEPAEAVLEELALRAPARALVLMQQAPFAGQVDHLSPSAWRSLASSADGAAVVLSIAVNAAAQVGRMEGYALHNLEQALALAEQINRYYERLGGEYCVITPQVATIRVLCAFVEAYPAASALAWDRANAVLTDLWPLPYGLLLAAAFANADAGLAVPAFSRLKVICHPMLCALAMAWMGRRDGNVLNALRAAVPAAKPVGGDPMKKTGQRLCRQVDLVDTLQVLALIAPEQIPHSSAAFTILKEAGSELLLALAENPERLESKAASGRVLGRFFGWLGQSAAAQLVAHAEAAWASANWEFALGEGLAASLAYQGNDAYRLARGNVFPYAMADGAMRIASAIIAERDPDEALRLIDSLPEQANRTRAELVGITAVAMRCQRHPALGDLPQRLRGYTASAAFLDVTAMVQRALNEPGKIRQTHGDTAALSAHALQTRARAICAALPAGDIEAAVQAMCASAPDEPAFRRMMWKHDLVLAFAQVQPPALRNAFLGHVRDLGPEEAALCPDVAAVLEAIAAPDGAMIRLLGTPETFFRIWIIFHLLAHLARHHPGLAFAAFAAAAQQEAEATSEMLEELAFNWPVEQWRDAIEGYFAWATQTTDTSAPSVRKKNAFFGTLLARLGTQAPEAAFNALDEITERLGDSYIRAGSTCADIIQAVASMPCPDAAYWPMLIARASRIGDQGRRDNALMELLDAVPRLAPSMQAAALCQVLAVMGAGPREPLHRQLEAIVRVARIVDPHLTGRGTALVDRLASLLQAVA